MNFDNFDAANEDETISIAVENISPGIQGLPNALVKYITDIGNLVDVLPEDDFLKAAAVKAEELVLTDGLLTKEQMIGSNETYKRHQLYADPEGRFTILALVWQPGQFTCIHGHSAWGVVGVREGEIKVDCFDIMPFGSDDPSALVQIDTISAGAGAVNCVGTAPKGIHRLGNVSDQNAITIHTYGMDLSEHPARINVVYAD